MIASIPSPPRRGGFTFKQFFVGHDRCGMKVSTDGVLLGAWAPLPTTRRVLDIGTGSGLLSLMLAQRLDAEQAPFFIDAIDIDLAAVEQAQENCAASPWQSHLNVWQQDILAWNDLSFERYGLVICNPPYFQNGKSYRDTQREKARDSSTLDHPALLKQVATLLTEEGYFSVILPIQEAVQFTHYARTTGWILRQQCDVSERTDMPAKRRMMTWRRCPTQSVTEHLVIRDEQGQYSTSFQRLTKEFYLAF
ncbi:tRNA1(Val) (adenine(37)-N6)-methyltransferase [Rosenbergiella nectarea]|uniref:tRNA1(Val) (adenine(37)-N6)-methyltransferase n=1 Tax=Rosenbergiella nectarea TaxID=988801 RepID=UPI001BDB4423|nr:methyltransferase [Rosenbergiella nectarea]MBT0730038.1 methyltransferase [Rosenbergiella nectarea subsp. apis]